MDVVIPNLQFCLIDKQKQVINKQLNQNMTLTPSLLNHCILRIDGQKFRLIFAPASVCDAGYCDWYRLSYFMRIRRIKLKVGAL